MTASAWRLGLAVGWTALAISVVGDHLLDFVLLVEATVASHRVSVGWLGLAVGVPVLLGGVVGSLVDRHAARLHRQILFVVTVNATAVLAIWAIWRVPALFSTVLYPLVAVVALMAVALTTIWNVLLPQLVDHDQERIKSAVGTTSIVISLGGAAGPTLGAQLLRWTDGQTLVLLDAASFVACGLLLTSAIRCPAARAPGAAEPEAVGRPAEPHRTSAVPLSFTEGARLVLSRESLRWPVISLAWMNFLLFGTMFVLPAVIRERGWPVGTLGGLMTALLLGGVVGSVAGKRFRSERHFTAYLALEPTLRAAALVTFFLAPTPAIGVAAMFLFALPQGLGRVARQSLLINEFPQQQRGRVMGSYQMMIRGAMPLAPATLAWAITVFGPSTFFLVNIAILLLIGALLALSLSRSRSRPRTEPTAERPRGTPAPEDAVR